ncbi:MAG TPA: hypothetical protein DDW65_18270 [Firmicutes bacterium]|nr:hypothetical protein [Bacillota bacterium]
MIKTKEFAFPKLVYLGILVKNSLKRSLWALVFLIAIAAYQATKGTSKTTFLVAALPVIYLSYVVIRCWIHSNSKKTNQLFFRERVFEIDDQTIMIGFKQGAATKIEINNIARVVKNSSYYLLFLNKKQFIYAPLSAFRTAGDIARFDSILKARKRRIPPLK